MKPFLAASEGLVTREWPVAEGVAVRRALRIIGIVGLLVVAPFVIVPSYDFPAPTPFRGPRWHNPYAGWSGPYRKVNLHAHSKTWGGLTAGDDSPEAMARLYADWGFDALALSNYHQVTQVDGAPLPMIRAYEHGFNTDKRHRLVLGADRAIGLDFPIATLASTQWLIDRLSADGVVGLNHPSLRGGLSCRDVQTLTGFQLFEVHNAYAVSLFEWDCALSAGRLAWAMGNDDAHAAREEKIGVAWNMVGSAQTSERELLAALTAGRSYVVRGERGRMDVEVRRLAVDEQGQVTIELSGPARIEWFTDGGMMRQVDDAVARSTFLPHRTDHYARAVISTPRTQMVLNPIVREGSWTAPVARPAWGLTVAGWGGWLVAAVALERVTRPRRQRLHLVTQSKAA